MKKFILAMWLCFLTLGCSNSISQSDLYRFDGIHAFAVTMETKVQQKCTCNGSKTTGDGLGPCQCGSHCMCKKEKAEVKGIQVWLFTQKNCGPCRKIQRNVLPALQKSGWKIANAGSGQEAHIVIFDMEKDEATFERLKIDSTPLFIRVVDGKPVQTHVGFMNQWDLGKFFKGELSE